MSVETKNVGSYEELYKILPELRYIKSTMTLNRSMYKYSSDNNNAVSSSFPNNQIIKFTIPASMNSLYNISEFFIDISGMLKLLNNGVEIAKSADAGIGDEDNQIIKVGENWIFNSIQKVQLFIGQALVYEINQPMALSKYIKMHFKDDRDIKNHNEAEFGYYSLQKPHKIAPFYDTNDNFYTHDYASELFCFNDDYFTLNQIMDGNDYTSEVQFSYILRLIDIFPQLEMGLKPIFGQQIEVVFTTENQGYTNINVMEMGNGTAKFDSVEIKRFEAFNLYAISYLLNVDMIDKLKSVYSKPVVEVIDDISYFNNSMQMLTKGSTLQLKCPLNLKFSTDFISLQIPNGTNNNFVLKESLYQATVEDMNYLMHNNNDLRFCNISLLEIYADSQLIYSKNYATQQIDVSANSLSPDLKAIAYSKVNGNDVYNDIYNFNDAYHLYKECRYCCGKTEEGAISFNDFLSSAFCFDIPVSAFTKLASTSQVQINITFGAGWETLTGIAGDIQMPSVSISNPKTRLDQLRVIIKNKKVLQFNGFNNCSVLDIVQNFDNDIYIQDNQDENAVKN